MLQLLSIMLQNYLQQRPSCHPTSTLQRYPLLVPIRSCILPFDPKISVQSHFSGEQTVYSYTASILPSSFLCPYVLNFNCVVSETWVHPFSTTKPTTILSLKVESSCLFNILQLQPSNIFQQSSNFHLKEWITKEYICVQLSPRPNLHFRSFIFFIKLLIIKIPCFSGPFRTVIFK